MKEGIAGKEYRDCQVNLSDIRMVGIILSYQNFIF